MEDASGATALLTPDYKELTAGEEQWIIDGMLAKGGSMLIHGNPKLGKSYLALQALAGITGESPDWLDYPIKEKGVGLYWQFDTPRGLWQTQHIFQMEKHGYPMEAVYHVDPPMMPEGFWPVDVLKEEHLDYLHEVAEKVKPLVVVVDTVRKMHSLDEDKSHFMKDVYTNIKSAFAPSAVIFITHSRKPKEDTPDSAVNDVRGSSFASGDVDTLVKCVKGRHGNYSLKLEGRAIAEESVPMIRDPYLWFKKPKDDEFEAQLEQVLQDTFLHSLRMKARELARISHKNEETCRSIVRRRMKGEPDAA